MGFLEKFRKPNKPASSTSSLEEGAVLIYIQGEDFDRMAAAQDVLMTLLDAHSEIGMFDGNEIGGDETILFMYGQDAETLFRLVEPALKSDDYYRGAKAVVRQGPPSSPTRVVHL